MERAPEGSFELENSDGDEVVDAIEESVDDLEVSVVSVEVDGRVSGSVKSGGGSSMGATSPSITRTSGWDRRHRRARRGMMPHLSWSVVASLSTTRT